MNLKEANQQFTSLLRSVNNKDKQKFIEHIFKILAAEEECENGHFDNDALNAEEMIDGPLDDPIALLNMIVRDIKEKVPINAILPSESISSPSIGENADCIADLTVHVDEFLYNEDEVEELIEDGKLKRNYCKDCGSKNVEPLIFISHSMSRDALYYIFNNRLPTLEDKTVLDIGSRLGAVIYGAYAFTDAPRIIGVEMNQDLCKLQNEIIHKYKMKNRVEVLHNLIEDVEEVVKSADVVIINNAFEFYISMAKQIEIWQYLRRTIKSETILVVRPHLETTLKNLNTGIVLKDWVKSYNVEGSTTNDFRDNSEFCDLAFYQVL